MNIQKSVWKADSTNKSVVAKIGNDQALGKAISPTLHLTKDNPPTLIGR